MIFLFLAFEHISFSPHSGGIFLGKMSVESVYYTEIGNPFNPPESAGFLIITPDTFTTSISPFVRWKEKQGYKVWLYTLSQVGGTNTEIKTFIDSAYHYFQPRPYYLLLVGDVDVLPTFTAPGMGATDHPYTTVDGGDFLPDLIVGRFSASTTAELDVIVAKTIGYESTQDTSSSYYNTALMVGANYPAEVTTALMTKRWVADRLKNKRFSVDSVFYPPIADGTTPINQSIDNGVIFVNYRGGSASPRQWDYPFYDDNAVYSLSNGWRLPVITSFVCYAGAFNDQSPMCLGETWIRVGTPANPKGAVGFIGASSAVTSTRWNNDLDENFYSGWLLYPSLTLGENLLYAKLKLLEDFPGRTDPDSGAEFYFNTYNILGDPSLIVWRAKPSMLSVSYPSVIPPCPSMVEIDVMDGTTPAQGVKVSLFKENEVRAIGYTDINGKVCFEPSPSTPGTLYITTTSPFYAPYSGYILVSPQDPYLSLLSYTIDDSSGNNNNKPEPGETLKVSFLIKNTGTIQATNIEGILSSPTPGIEILDSTKSLGNINAGDSIRTGKYTFYCASRDTFSLILNLSPYSTHIIPIPVYVPDVYLDSIMGNSGNPGDTLHISVWISNQGNISAFPLISSIRINDLRLSYIDSVETIDNFSPGGETLVSFSIKLSSSVIPGEVLSGRVYFSSQSRVDTSVIYLFALPYTSSASSGPDAYGYYAIEDVDSLFPLHPSFAWKEISTQFGGSGTPLNLTNDTTVVVNLPFEFIFYGKIYNKISVSSNGFIIPGESRVCSPYNWPIPEYTGPEGIIAPMWDDFDPSATDSSDDVYTYYNQTDSTFIIEWSRVQHIHGFINPQPAELQTYEVIIYNKDAYPTKTGDNSILFQYLNIQDDDSAHNYATMGIEAPYENSGLQLSFNHQILSTLHPLTGGRSILLSTLYPAGIKEIKHHPVPFSVYPNPCFGVLNITGEAKRNGTISIYDLLGRKVYSHSIKRGIFKVRWKRNISGIYFVLFSGKEKWVKKIVILRR